MVVNIINCREMTMTPFRNNKLTVEYFHIIARHAFIFCTSLLSSINKSIDKQYQYR